jgi:hypothetical protein
MPSLQSDLIYPLFAMFILTTIVMLRMFWTRVSAIKSGQVKLRYFKVYPNEELPEKMVQASRHFSNLFEMPVLFYLVSVLGILFQEGQAFLILAWVYVLARVVQAYIHLGSNRVIRRMQAYAVSWAALSLMWVILLWHQIFSVPV